jgi:hypothetical protein
LEIFCLNIPATEKQGVVRYGESGRGQYHLALELQFRKEEEVKADNIGF